MSSIEFTLSIMTHRAMEVDNWSPPNSMLLTARSPSPCASGGASVISVKDKRTFITILWSKLKLTKNNTRSHYAVKSEVLRVIYMVLEQNLSY